MAGDPDVGPLARLAASVQSLAETIASTERRVQDRADVLVQARAARGRIRPIPTVDEHTGLRRMNGHADYIALADAAKLSGRHPEVLRRWCAEGKLPAVRIGRAWAIRRETLDELGRRRSRSRPRLSRAAPAPPPGASVAGVAAAGRLPR